MLSMNVQVDLAMLVRMLAVDNFQKKLTNEEKGSGSTKIKLGICILDS